MTDNERLTSWFLLHHSATMSIAFSFAPTPDVIDDIIQTAYLEFVKEAGAEDDDTTLMTLLRRATRRVAQRYWDERHRNKPEKLEDIGRHLCRLAESHFEDRRYEEEILALRTCLAKLTPKSRKIIEERYLMNNSIDSISRRFNVTKSAVYKTLNNIKNVLRQCILQTIRLR